MGDKNGPYYKGYGADYSFTGHDTRSTPNGPLVDALQWLVKQASALSGYEYKNPGVLINKYSGRRCSMAPHKDNEGAVDNAAPLVNITLGGARTFSYWDFSAIGSLPGYVG